MTKVGHVFEVTFFHQVTDSPSKVEEESFGMTAVDECLSAECRQPGTYVVPPTLQEFIGKPLSPRLWPSLPTINEKVSEDTPIDLLCQLKDFLWIIREMHIQSRCVHLVTFQASPFPCSWVIGLAGGRIAETQHSPFSTTKCPSQHAIDIDKSCHVNHFPRIDDFHVRISQYADIAIIIHLGGRKRQRHLHLPTFPFSNIRATRDLRLTVCIMFHR